MEKISQTNIQAKLFDFSLNELVRSQRTSFKPIWTVESWAKFLIWLGLNCGLSGERQDLELFANALGAPLTSRMRRIFFQRTVENLSLHVMADPSEKKVLVMPMVGENNDISYEEIAQCLEDIGLDQRVSLNKDSWHKHDSLISIPWNSVESDI